MPNIDSITPHPKKVRKKASWKSPLGESRPAGLEAKKRKRLVWFSVISVTAVILVVWFGTLDERLRFGNANNSAWQNLKQRLSEVFSFSKPANEAIKNINPGDISESELEYLREQVFPAELNQGLSNQNSNLNQNGNQNSNSNLNANAS
ncbi:hypothetical protein C4546_01115 [Candidatus Parcubacteria bacterium]|jgi:hypothetical protein|nr:MAG: hypothetical protein C4546_01115 [Candidatus Parcubacteria bacterium]